MFNFIEHMDKRLKKKRSVSKNDDFLKETRQIKIEESFLRFLVSFCGKKKFCQNPAGKKCSYITIL
jgi:hypothetical protein